MFGDRLGRSWSCHSLGKLAGLARAVRESQAREDGMREVSAERHCYGYYVCTGIILIKQRPNRRAIERHHYCHSPPSGCQIGRRALGASPSEVRICRAALADLSTAPPHPHRIHVTVAPDVFRKHVVDIVHLIHDTLRRLLVEHCL